MNVGYVIKHNLCLGCGLCEDMCPKEAICLQTLQGEYRPKVNEDLCLGDKCERCVSICPGLGVNFCEIEKRIHQESELNESQYLGQYKQLFTGYCTNKDIRYHSASGGMVTGLLIYLLEKKIIEGAVVTQFSVQDNITPKTFIARTKEELISARSSKYCPVSMQGIRKQIREAEGKYVIVGIPCHIHGFRKIEQIDKKFKDHVFAYWGLYCSSGRTFNLTDYVFQKNRIEKETLSYFQYRDNGCMGNLVAEDRNGKKEIPFEMYYPPLRSFFIPRRCHLCIDHSAELSDMSFGDIHVKPYSDDKIGINSVIARNNKMQELLIQAEKDGVIEIVPLEEEVWISSQKMARVKKNKYASLVYWGKRIGLKVPEYNKDIRGNMGFVKALVFMLNLNLQYQIGHYKLLWHLIKYTIKKK
ncbi:MAG: Coenzyme F420 hydrogenase/dehydrogenase, beta subunit C-terminal domain [Paludibacteraceae bacterium]|nr:Coenzyme F420 hydrogenase/dehydrogenase, beta subunit C-terminal domain [Paludibacteraceae bacterium]